MKIALVGWLFSVLHYLSLINVLALVVLDSVFAIGGSKGEKRENIKLQHSPQNENLCFNICIT